MRAVRALTDGFGFSANQPWLPNMPHVAAALATYFVFGGAACVTGLMLATLASFVVFLPMTALTLNGGRAIAADAVAPVLTAKARLVLLGLWTATAWTGAWLGAAAV
ncbi:MAG TPA: hypothetical protein DDZ81_20635 [Acetobacteraceae bacterium]|jgi:hypothetical protein|nr:hypothetical protein [Acetobacteraceae bacterium]